MLQHLTTIIRARGSWIFFLLVVLCFLPAGSLYSQLFTEQTGISLDAASVGWQSWGDYDNDGDLDILLSGRGATEMAVSKIYRNNGDNTFSELSNSGLEDISESFCAWGDYDQDGDLDILLAGKTPDWPRTEVTRIYKNNGDNTFSELEGLSLTGLLYATGGWIDTDKDGDLDLLLAGRLKSGDKACLLFRNDSNDSFTELQPGIVPFTGSMIPGDFNNDSYSDFLVNGVDYSGNLVCKIYTNNRDNTFTMLLNTGLQNIGGGADWGDYDNDGDLDVVVSGLKYFGGDVSMETFIYQNQGNNSFVELTDIDLLGLNCRAVFWIDIDNDGDLDIFNTGYSGATGYVSVCYENQGDDTFIEFEDPLPYFNSEISWADYDNDSDLDALTTGYLDNGAVTRIFRNNAVLNNTEPSAPQNLSSKAFAKGAELYWSKANDAETGQECLTYNIAVSGTKDSVDACSPMSDLVTGYRRIATGGNAFNDTSYFISGLDTGKYYWSVQAIDNSYLGSPFAILDSFTVLPHFSEVLTDMQNVIEGSCSPGDYDADGDLDVLISGRSKIDYIPFTEIYRNDGNGLFVDIDAGLSQSKVGSSAWCDYDRDGDLDLVLTGTIDDNIDGYITELYNYETQDSFKLQPDPGLTAVYDGSSSWGDLNNDGLCDIVITGQVNASPYNGMYRNMGDGTFSRERALRLNIMYNSSSVLADYDNDMDIDILVSGWASDFLTCIYRNDGDFDFTKIDAELMGFRGGSSAWGDYDNDGDLDLVVSGRNYASEKHTKVYRNDGADTFTDINAQIRGVVYGKTKWGDHDNDGDLDLLVSGESGTKITNIYLNNGQDEFVAADYGFTGLYESDQAWMDYDNDRDLDILVTGADLYGNETTRIYRNNGNFLNSRPGAPGNLKAESYGFGAIFTWDAAIDDQTPSQALTYNIRVGTVSGASDVISSMSDAGTGDLYLPQMGNCYQNKGWFLESLPVGTYYWSVQAVDNTFLGGDWAPEQTFTITTVNALFHADTACEGLPTNFADQSISSAGPITAWKWDFSDGGTSSAQDTAYVFSSPGVYSVQLIAVSGDYADTIVKEILVKAKPEADFNTDVVCQGEPTNIMNVTNLNGTSVTEWSWDFGDGSSSNLQDPGTHGYLNAGEYLIKLMASADNGCTDTISKKVSVGAFPDASVSVGSNPEICSGDSIILSNSYNENYQYQWQINGANLSGEDSCIYVARTSGDYSVTVTNTLGSCTNLSDALPVAVNPYPQTPVIKSRNYEMDACPNDNPVSLSVETEEANVSYQWLRNGVTISGESASRLTGYLQEGDYSVEANNGYCSVESQVLTIRYGNMPDKPGIIVTGPVVWYLACDDTTATKYRWYRNSYRIGGAEGYLYVAGTIEGKYEVAISKDGSCFAISDPVWIPLGTGIEDDPWEQLKIYPNPTPGMFTLEMDNGIMGELIIDIYAETGSKILNIQFMKETRHFKTQIDLSGQPPASYMIGLLIDRYRTNRTLIVE